MNQRAIYTNQMQHYIDTPLIKVITGIRRSGKSSLLQLIINLLIDRGINKQQIISINFESLKFSAYRNYQSMYDYIIEETKNIEGRKYIFIDEIQEVNEFEKAIKSLKVDLDCDIYLTGSNAHLLAGELSTYLSGRYIEFSLYTLSFKEYTEFYNISNNMETAFYDYLKYGGFPGLCELPNIDKIKTEYIKGIYNSVVIKDVVKRYSIRDFELLERILVYIMDNIGQIFSAKKIADYLKNQGKKASIDSIYSYINALENAMIIYTAKRFDIKGKKLLDRMEKYFIADLGLRYTMLGNRPDDIAQILENVVFFELKRRYTKVYIGKLDDLEVDFIAENQNDKIYIQVSYLLANEKVIEREYKPFGKIKDNYRKLVLSLDKAPFENRDGVEWMNIIDFVMNVGNERK